MAAKNRGKPKIKNPAKHQRSNPRISAEEMKTAYMDSPHLHWSAFAETMGIDGRATMQLYPTTIWKLEKRKALIDQERERLKDSVVEMMGSWHADVKQTLRKYPQVADAALGLIVEKIKSMHEQAKAGKMSMIDTQSLSQLASAINTITQAKHRALMIDQFAVDVPAMIDSASQIAKDVSSEDSKNQLEIIIKSIDNKNASEANIDNYMADYYDFNKAKGPQESDYQLTPALLPEGVEETDEIEKLLKEAENT